MALTIKGEILSLETNGTLLYSSSHYVTDRKDSSHLPTAWTSGAMQSKTHPRMKLAFLVWTLLNPVLPYINS